MHTVSSQQGESQASWWTLIWFHLRVIRCGLGYRQVLPFLAISGLRQQGKQRLPRKSLRGPFPSLAPPTGSSWVQVQIGQRVWLLLVALTGRALCGLQLLSPKFTV